MYPYPELIHLLEIQCDSKRYKELGYSHTNINGLSPLQDPEYINIIPTYLYARCPICYAECVSKMDTYNICSLPFLTTKYSLDGLYIIPSDYPQNHNPPCTHFLGTHTFKNLHDIKPLELDEQIEFNFNFRWGEVPYITPWFLLDDVESYAVLHALPCCRIEDDKFVPSYTLFILTYFSIQPRLLINLHYEKEFAYMREDKEYYPVNVLPAYPNKESVQKTIRDNLSHWAEQGKLGFLDFREDDLPLVIGKSVELPNIYQEIRGRRYSFKWADGKFGRFY